MSKTPRTARMGGSSDDPMLDVLGLGFGPSNLSLAIALEEYNAAMPANNKIRAVFCERAPDVEWHPGMLLEDAQLQVSFLKDLVTMRNPQSPFTFINFLKCHDRLPDFINRGSTEPLRLEFAAYLRWAAAQLTHLVRFSTTVVALTPVSESGTDQSVDHFLVTVEVAGERHQLRARNVIVAAGLQPRWPTGVDTGAANMWHSAHFLPRLAAFEAARGPADPRAFAVFGSGQSAAEVTRHLYSRFPSATVHLVSSRFGLGVPDDGPLTNQIFDPVSVDQFHGADPQVRERLAGLHHNANYSAVNRDLIADLYNLWYRDRWLGRDRLVFHRLARLQQIQAHEHRVSVQLIHDLERVPVAFDADAAVFATGYRPFDCAQVLGLDSDLIRRDLLGRPEVDRDFRARLIRPGQGGLYLVGQSEHQHGIATTLLSTVAVRAGEIAESIITNKLDAQAIHHHERVRASA